MNLKKLGIRQQVLYLVLACSLITLFVAGGIALYGIFKIKSNSLEIGMEIGQVAAEDSSEALKEVSLASLQSLVHERSKQVDFFLQDLLWDVTMLTNQMEKILRNPENYPPRQISQPTFADDGRLVPQLQYNPGTNPATVATEVGLTANLQDFQIRVFDSSPDVASNYVVSKNGFYIITDTVAGTRINPDGTPKPVDFSTRPWYVKTMREQKMNVSDVFLDSQGRGLAIACASPYHSPDGEIAGVIGEGVTLDPIIGIVKRTKIGETGFAFVMNNETGRLLFTSKTEGEFSISSDLNLENDPILFDSDDPTIVELAKKMAAGETGVTMVEIDDKKYYVAYKPLEYNSWSFGAGIEEAEVTAPAVLNREVIEKSTDSFVETLNDSIKFMLAAMIIAFISIMALVPFVAQKIADMFVHPLHILSAGVREITSGNLDKKIEVNTGNELEHLAICFNAMTDELKTQMKNLEKVTADKERIATELNVAKDIQLGILPRDFDFGRKDFEIFAKMNAAKEVGGDFYDVYLLDENHLVMTVADVSGKGIPAALFMMISKTILKNFATFATTADDYAGVVACANNQLCQNNDEMMFVTVFFGVLELTTGRFIFVNGGHNPPIIYHAKENRCEYLDVKKNFVLGAMDEVPFKQQEIIFERGDMIFAYTDGVNEAMNIDHEEYTSEKLLEFMNQTDCTADLEEILKNVRADVAEHVRDAEQSDDITMMALRFNGD